MISANQAYYIKLGQKSGFQEKCLNEGIVGISYRDVPRMEEFDAQIVRNTYLKKGKTAATSTNHARQVGAFYTANENTLWITFAHGKLYWCIAEKEIHYLDAAKDGELTRYRKTLNGWHDKDINGAPLYMHTLNGALTKTVRYQGTICEIDSSLLKYLVQRIRGEATPEIVAAQSNKTAAISSILALMKLLNPMDFELLVELVFSRSGWQRINETGGSQKTSDFELYIPILDAYAFVQVKSETSQKELEDYEEQLGERNDEYMFYVYHTAKKQLKPRNPKTKLIGTEKLSELVLNAGLFDWLLKKTQ